MDSVGVSRALSLVTGRGRDVNLHAVFLFSFSLFFYFRYFFSLFIYCFAIYLDFQSSLIFFLMEYHTPCVFDICVKISFFGSF